MVQTGLYGPDNRFIVDAVKAHPKQLRAIALIGEDITDRALRDLTDGGVRGFRVNRTAKTGTVVRGGAQARRARQGPWLACAVPARHEDHPDLDSFLGNFPTEVVIDHMGRPDPKKGVDAPGFRR
jgi:2-pyrone-4,6-dicarboxylate lactonase